MNTQIIPRVKISIVIILSLLASVLSPLTGCATSDGSSGYSRYASPATRSGFCFDTLISITISDSKFQSSAYENSSSSPSDYDELLDECFAMCSRYEGLLSMTVSGSDISRINSAGAGEAVTVSSDTLSFLEAAMHYYEISDGLLDISVAPLTRLWTQARTDGVPPENDSISGLLPHTGLNKLTLDPGSDTVTKSDPDLKLDPGSLGKGYVADRLKEFLTGRGVSSAIISLGGNIVTIGQKPDGSDYRIGIKQPFSENNEVAASLHVNDLSVVTSGVYERYFLYEDRICHHILDPSDGYPADTDLYSATIISESSLDGDALSTICILLGFKGAEKLIESTSGIEAVLITDDNMLHYTEGALKYAD